MSDAWKPVWDKIKVQFLADVKKELGEIDWSGNTLKDIAQSVKAALDILDVLDNYADEVEALTPEDRRSLFAHAFDEVVKLTALLEPWDDNVGAWLYDLFTK